MKHLQINQILASKYLLYVNRLKVNNSNEIFIFLNFFAYSYIVSNISI